MSDFVHLHSHSIFSTLDGCSKPEEYFKECAKRGSPAQTLTEHGTMSSIPDAYFAAKEFGVKYIVGCFLPHQRVFTNNGVKRISDIRCCDKTLTHLNKFNNVKNVQIRHYNGDVIKIRAWCVEDQIATPEHPFLVREVIRQETSKGVWKDNICVKWIKAGELKREKYCRTYCTKKSKNRANKRRYRHYLCVPRFKGDGINYINITDFIRHDGILNITDSIIESVTYNSVTYNKKNYKTTKPINLPIKLELDNNLLWIMGLWLAEGSIQDGLDFSLSSDEYHFYEKICDYFARFNISTSYRFRNSDSESRPREALDVHVYSTYFGRLFLGLFGEHFDNKKIPNQFLEKLSSEQAFWILEGLLDGDAKRTADSSCLKLNNETLIWQSRLLMTKLSEPRYSAVTKNKSNNSDKIGYSIRKRERGHFYYDYDEDFIYLPIHQVDREYYNGDVYNLEVEEDNSYNTGVAVHNCEIYFNDYELKRQKMFAEDIKIGQIDKELVDRIRKNRHLTVLCKNMKGYQNLLTINQAAWDRGFYYKPRAWFDLLSMHHEGLIILSGCLNGPISFETWATDMKKSRKHSASEYIDKFNEVWGDDFYIEVQMPGIEFNVGDEMVHDSKVFQKLIQLADEKGKKVVITNDSHYMKREDFQVQKVMMAIDQGVTIDDPNLFHVNSDEQFFKTRKQLRETFQTGGYADGVEIGMFEKACDTTLEIAEKCDNFRPDLEPKLPSIADADRTLVRLALKSLKEKGLDKNTTKYMMDGAEITYYEQMKIELGRFIEKGFSSYFLITKDFVDKAKRMHGEESVGPSRGSAGGSLVCFLLGIVTLDPLKWGLSFDRFLSSSRGGNMLKVMM